MTDTKVKAIATRIGCLEQLWETNCFSSDFWTKEYSIGEYRRYDIIEMVYVCSNRYFVNVITTKVNELQNNKKNDFWYYFFSEDCSLVKISADLNNPFAIVKYCEKLKNDDETRYLNTKKEYSLKSMNMGYYKGALLYLKCLSEFDNLEEYYNYTLSDEKERNEYIQALKNVLQTLIQFSEKYRHAFEIFDGISDIYDFF